MTLATTGARMSDTHGKTLKSRAAVAFAAG